MTPDDDTSDWERALDRLEADVLVAEQVAAGQTPMELGPWSAPEPATPLPAHLAERARAVLQRQQQLLTTLPEAAARVRRQLGVTRRISSATAAPAGPSLYVDANA